MQFIVGGGIGFGAKASANVPPFPLDAADNGLSVDPVTFQIVFGGTDAAPSSFLSNRRIDLNSFAYTLGAAGNEQFIIDEANALYLFGLIGVNNLEIDGGSSNAQIELAGSKYMRLDAGGGQYMFGSIDGGVGIATLLELNDANSALIFVGGDQYFSIDIVNRNYQLGQLFTDEFSIVNGDQARIIIDGIERLNVVGSLNFYAFGDVGNAVNGTRLAINDAGQIIQFQSNGLDNLYFDAATGFYEFGDLGLSLNGSKIKVDDANNAISFTNNAANVGIIINGSPGFTGTVAPVNSITVDNGIVTNVT